MTKKYLVLDCNYLCHRAKHSTGGLSYDNTPTGIMYGFLKSITAFQELFNTHHIIFCWDSKTNKREEIYPAYKQKRRDRVKEWTEEELEFENAFRLQMKKLRRIYLKKIGYKNVFVQRGYEADDLIAAFCMNISMKDEAIIISSDKDLYQLISPNVSFYSPQKGKVLTLQGFKKQYNITPDRWAEVKAIAGCPTDDIVGVKGVGEKTAIAFLNDELKKTTKAFWSIKDFCWDSKTRLKFLLNLSLTQLPFEGAETFQLREDKISKKGWKQVMKKLGMKSIRDKGPTTRKRKLL